MAYNEQELIAYHKYVKLIEEENETVHIYLDKVKPLPFNYWQAYMEGLRNG